jgi:hypothetical protein
VVVRCTKKLLILLGRGVALTELPPSGDDWYANLLWIDRRKCVLLVHADTLFPVFRADVGAGELRPFGSYVVRAVEEELREEGLRPDVLGRLDADDVHIARTASRAILGHMNEMALSLRYQIDYARGLDDRDTRSVNHRLRRTLHGRGGVFAEPLDLVAERLASK